jgi:hypothetical protein
MHIEKNWRPDPFQFTENIDLTQCKTNIEDRKYRGDVCTRCGAVVNEPAIPQ